MANILRISMSKNTLRTTTRITIITSTDMTRLVLVIPNYTSDKVEIQTIVDPSGFGPLTSSLQMRRSTS